jgi:hypothetical protein
MIIGKLKYSIRIIYTNELNTTNKKCFVIIYGSIEKSYLDTCKNYVTLYNHINVKLLFMKNCKKKKVIINLLHCGLHFGFGK